MRAIRCGLKNRQRDRVRKKISWPFRKEKRDAKTLLKVEKGYFKKRLWSKMINKLIN